MMRINFISISVLTFILVAVVHARPTSPAVQERIAKVKVQLGDNLLTTADEVIARHVQAVGGRDAILAVKTLMFKGRIVFGAKNPYLYRYYQQPNHLRVSRSPENENYFVADGDRVWSVTPEGRQEQTAWWAKSLNHQRIDGNFIDYGKRGVVYEYMGLKGFESEPDVYYHLRRTFPDGYIEDLYFHVETGLLHCLWKTSSPRKNNPEFYYDYRRVGGILFPHMWVTGLDVTRSPHVLVIEEIKTNVDFGQDFFTEYKEKPVAK
jgi:hypothetical protein